LHDYWAEGASPAAVVAGAAAAIGAVTIAAADSEQKRFAAIGIKADGWRCVVDLGIAG
jgi:hypothetical protein